MAPTGLTQKGCHHGPPEAQNNTVFCSCHPTAERQPPNPVLPRIHLPLQCVHARPLPGPRASRCKARSGAQRLRGESSESPGSAGTRAGAQTPQHSKPHKARADSEFCGEMVNGGKASLPTVQKDLERWPKEQHSKHTRWWGGKGVLSAGGTRDRMGGPVCQALVGDLTSRKTPTPSSRDWPREGLPPQLLTLPQTQGSGSTDRANADALGEAVICCDVLIQLLDGPLP